MGIVYIEKRFCNNRQWTDLETCIQDLLSPSYPNSNGQLEDLEEQIGHMRDCLARFIAHQNPTMETLNRVFYADIRIEESDDE